MNKSNPIPLPLKLKLIEESATAINQMCQRYGLYYEREVKEFELRSSRLICVLHCQKDEAAFIVNACNSHYKLVKAVKLLLEQYTLQLKNVYNFRDEVINEYFASIKEAKKALAEAGGE